MGDDLKQIDNENIVSQIRPTENNPKNETLDSLAKTEPNLETAKIETAPPAAESTETKTEQPKINIDKEKNFLEETVKSLGEKLRTGKKKPTLIPQVRDQLVVDVEKIMEDGLSDAFKQLTPIQQQQFKIKGEETAFQVRDLLKQTHVKVKTIFRLILEWLKMLPGINRFFLEQEAKIKTDKILALHNFEKHK